MICVEGRNEVIMPAAVPEELRRSEYRGFILVEVRLPSALSYGSPTFARWEISRIEQDGTRSPLGYESSEQFAKLVVDHIVNSQDLQGL